MNEERPITQEDRAELLRHAYREMAPALAKFCEPGHVLEPAERAILLVGAAAAILAATGGPEFAAAKLRGLANDLAAPTGASLN